MLNRRETDSHATPQLIDVMIYHPSQDPIYEFIDFYIDHSLFVCLKFDELLMKGQAWNSGYFEGFSA
jgi:hypothetical protein